MNVVRSSATAGMLCSKTSLMSSSLASPFMTSAFLSRSAFTAALAFPAPVVALCFGLPRAGCLDAFDAFPLAEAGKTASALTAAFVIRSLCCWSRPFSLYSGAFSTTNRRQAWHSDRSPAAIPAFSTRTMFNASIFDCSRLEVRACSLRLGQHH